ncbi:hypothetical protein COCSADRAFT_348818 [Bipolaris sorokiniana ND90Pr]|uniref:Uncharacterized protein n=1 Tax=Cochliobolus sativus (strain ND90Pr / ATCC 201652) TaxID=665912 RepID=M2SNA1_COCSN|nr:uncharacterized protein COCSADRAFT_348818 [Bipolaris sorokiniana ND90Pr]EMD58601.1 hypothetical protein COCSADRAFT_348818 [Bipolaris sorokiniana ND90Pr]
MGATGAANLSVTLHYVGVTRVGLGGLTSVAHPPLELCCYCHGHGHGHGHCCCGWAPPLNHCHHAQLIQNLPTHPLSRRPWTDTSTAPSASRLAARPALLADTFPFRRMLALQPAPAMPCHVLAGATGGNEKPSIPTCRSTPAEISPKTPAMGVLGEALWTAGTLGTNRSSSGT